MLLFVQSQNNFIACAPENPEWIIYKAKDYPRTDKKKK
uniref:Uncharacterized protein n=1 Tax=Arundo donax TaxID=35708 RepID=A0A0A9BZ90_ARUDO